MNSCIIYKFTFPNGKTYIGQTVQKFDRRMNDYKRDSNNKNRKDYNRLINKAIRKYVWDNIKKEIILYCGQDQADYYERELIKLYNSTDRNLGYNLESGGHKNKIVSVETKRKMSKKRKLCSFTDEHKNNISKSLLGRKLSKEHVEKIRLYNIGNKNMLGKKHSKETIETIKKSLIGRKQTIETKRKRYKSIDMLDKNRNFIKTFESISEASNKLNIYQGSISNVLVGRSKTAGGYVWRYV